MKKLSVFILSFFLGLSLLLTGCTYDSPETICIEHALDHYGMRPYKGEIVSNCWLDYLVLYKWNDEFFFDWENDCIDKSPSPTNCNGESIFDIYPDSIISSYFKEEEAIRIVGVR